MKVKFLPKKSIDVTICDIYEDRDAIIIQHTDTLLDNTCFNVEALGFKFGIKPCAFHWPYSGIQSGLKDIVNTGVLKFGVYIPTDRYRNQFTAAYLPDYSSTTISSAGASYYGKTVGESKLSGFPNNGQELFDYSNGVKGYDIIGGVPGSENNIDFTSEMDYIDQWFYTNFKKYPSAGSDRQGKIGSKEIYMPYYLGIRSTTVNSSVANHIYTGLDRLDFIHKSITSRWENGFSQSNMNAVNTALINSINTAFNNKGMFNDFLHWHRAISVANDIHKLYDLYELIYNTVNNRNAWYTGYSEAVEYYWYKTMVKRVRGSIIDNQLHLIADFDDDFFNNKIAGIKKDLVYSRINQPLSVKVDLTGTYFEGKNIKSNYGKILSLGNNQYIIDIPFQANGNDLKNVIISETATANYKNFTKPSVLSRIGNNITTDLPTKAVVFAGDFNQTMSVQQRLLDFSTSHSLNLSSDSKYVGLVTEDGLTTLYTL